MIAMTIVTPKAAPKHEPLNSKLVAGTIFHFRQLFLWKITKEMEIFVKIFLLLSVCNIVSIHNIAPKALVSNSIFDFADLPFSMRLAA